MPSGKRITGWKTPTTLGSGTVGEDFTDTAPTDAYGNASRTAARTWRMPLTQRTTMHRAPTAQSPQIASDIQSTGWVTARDGAMLEKSSLEKGSLACSIANENGGAIGTSARCPNQRPAVERMANGIRNFAEAASHNPYRARGPNLRQTTTRSPTAAANSVDCHT